MNNLKMISNTTTTTTKKTTKRKERGKYQFKDYQGWCNIIEEASMTTVPEVSQKYDIPLSTLYQKLRKFRQDDLYSLVPKKRGSSEGALKKKKIDEVKGNFLIEQLKIDNTLSGHELAKKLIQQTQTVDPTFTISKTTVNKYLKDKNYSYKVSMDEEIERNSAELKLERLKYAKLVLEEGIKPDDQYCIYYDVTYREHNAVRRHARSIIGTPAVVPKAHRGIYFNKDPSTFKKKSKDKTKPEKHPENTQDEDTEESENEANPPQETDFTGSH